MKILQLSTNDLGGVGIKLKKAISEHTEHECRAVRSRDNYIGYEGDVTLSGSDDERRELIEWADIVHCHEYTGVWEWVKHKPLVWHLHGGFFKQNYRSVNEFLDVRKIRTVVATVDLLELRPSADWLPAPIEIAPLASYRDPPNGTFRLVQTTTKNEFGVVLMKKDTLRKDLTENGELDIVFNETHEEALRRKGRASVVFDQWSGPIKEAWQTGALGISGLEAMAMEIPVISCGSEDLLVRMREMWGELPFLPTTRETLPLHLKMLRENPALRQHWAKRGHAFVKQWHDPETVAKQAVAMYEEVL